MLIHTKICVHVRHSKNIQQDVFQSNLLCVCMFGEKRYASLYNSTHSQGHRMMTLTTPTIAMLILINKNELARM